MMLQNFEKKKIHEHKESICKWVSIDLYLTIGEIIEATPSPSGGIYFSKTSPKMEHISIMNIKRMENN